MGCALGMRRQSVNQLMVGIMTSLLPLPLFAARGRIAAKSSLPRTAVSHTKCATLLAKVGDHGRCCAGSISWADLGSGTHTARALSASITRAGIW